MKITDSIQICDIDDNIPPSVKFSLSITENMQVKAYTHHSNIYIFDILGFAHQLHRWSQLQEIINRAKNTLPCIDEAIVHMISEINSLYAEQSDSITFLLDQLKLAITQSRGRRYSSHLIHHAVSIFLSSQSAYRTASTF